MEVDLWEFDNLFGLEKSEPRYVEVEYDWTSDLKGAKRHPVICQAISEGRMGIVFTEEHKKNLSLSHRGPRKPLTEETKKRISESNTGKRRTQEQKEYITEKTRETMKELNQKTYWFISPEGKVFCETTTISEFCRKHNLNKGTMNRVLWGHRKHHKGWKVFFHNPEEK